MIEVKNLVKKFGDFAALDGASINVETGSVYGLVGPNGSGKSTLIKHLIGVYKQNSGTIKIDGEEVYENVAVKQKISAIPDDWCYFFSATPRDMMNFYKGFYNNFSMERYEKLKGVFGLDENRAIRTFSKGMQKQVSFWLALSLMPEYLVLDEPVDGLDPVMRRVVWNLMMDDVKERGTTVLVSSHNLRDLEDVCDHVGILDKGKVILEKPLDELQGNMVKLQVAFPDDVLSFPGDIPVKKIEKLGKIYTVVMSGTSDEARASLAKYNPIFVDALPLTLEEVFIFEVGGKNNAVKDILL